MIYSWNQPSANSTRQRLKYLGLVIKEGRISMDPRKLKGFRDWPTPLIVKQTRGFWGFGNFYQWFIWHFLELAKPLNDLLKKYQTFEWCYVEFHPEHSLVFSATTWLRSTHSTLTRPFEMLTPSCLHSLSTALPCQHHTHHTNHRRIMPGPSRNHLGTFWAVTEWHQKYHRFI